MHGSGSDLHRTNVYRTVNEIVPDLDFRMLSEDFSRDRDVRLGRVSDDGLVMQAFMRIRI